MGPRLTCRRGARGPRGGRALRLRWLGGALVLLGLARAWAVEPGPDPAGAMPRLAQKPGPPAATAPEIVVYASDLTKRALFEFEFWRDPASPGGVVVGTPNEGDDLDPPPEDDPHVRFKVQVRRGIPYRCWIHMKVGKPKGKSQANLLYVQFTDAVDPANRPVLRPGTASYLTARGPVRPGWAWVGCDPPAPQAPPAKISFGITGEVTVHVQAGMEGVAFDQVVLSPARFLQRPPSEAVVPKPPR